MTTVTVTADGLRHALTGMSKVIASKSKLPILSCVRLRVAEGCLEITATDLDTTAKHSMPAQVDGDTAFTPLCVSFSQLKKLVNGKNGKETGFAFIQSEKVTPAIPAEKEGDKEIPEKRELIIKLGYTLGGQRLEVKLDWLPADEFPPTPECKGIGFELDHYEIKSMLTALPFGSEDRTRYVLNGVCLDGKNESSNAIVATDGRRLQMFSNVFFPEGLSIIVPSQATVLWWLAGQAEPDETWSVWYDKQVSDLNEEELKELRRLEKDDTTAAAVIKADKRMTFSIKNWIVNVKEIEGNYPNWKQVVPDKDSPHTRIELTDAAIEFINNSMPALPENVVYSMGHKEPTVIIATEGEDVYLRVKMSDDDIVGFKIPGAKAVHGGREDVIACFNRHFLQEGLKVGFNTWLLTDELSPLLLVGDNKKHALMPMRMS